ncbi:hypothetical protein CDO52_01225 [Nocardiopsis gilva YIM 90087]|uniref:DNA 3'-5' helicase n=1 Tax=Nocardiopsis gilva YIM 90087 TaxID=1235441 RepID=A0A223S0H4_9ACTN|nr:3'-5' exonuclease [Nocardiopsis gilva]ASU81597.1 hypothetical protein CDO52_01225 [Nocardiopsis gilva YIM 90087]
MNLPQPKGRQSHVIYLPATGHQVVLGTAGTGKTVMAAMRALHLSQPGAPAWGRTLLITYNRALAKYLANMSGGDTENFHIRTYGRFARGYLKDRGLIRGRNILGKGRVGFVRRAVHAAATNHPGLKLFEREAEWFRDEISWITGMGFQDKEEYLESERLGRKTPIRGRAKEAVWDVLEHYREVRKSADYDFDWDDIAITVRHQLALDDSPRHYRHIVIDEGQDLSPEQIRSLADAAAPDGSVTFFGDYAQQIYGQAMSWKSCGLKVRKVERFQDNYRNSTAIANVAIALSSQPFFGKSDDLIAPIAPSANGPKPTLVKCRNQEEEIRVIRDTAQRLAAEGTVAIIGRTWADLGLVCQGLSSQRLDTVPYSWDADPGIYHTTFHSAKGLEFQSVLIPFCGAASMPMQETVDYFGAEDAWEREAKLLYVAITRAKSDLLITYSGDRTPLLPTDDGLFTEIQP